MEGATAEGAAACDAPMPSQLRQRMLNRAATVSEGAQPSPTRPLRRRSSLLSDLSDTRHSMRSSTDSLVRNLDAHDTITPLEESPRWLSVPVAFAIFPAVGGLLYQNGAAVLTDVFTLGLASWFLHWCCTFPWTWYHSAQQRRYIEADEQQSDDTILEEDEDSNDAEDDGHAVSESSKERDQATAAQVQASAALKRQERMAFAACFLGPLVGACLLHTIRGQLKVTEGLVSDYNLTIFVMVAELRPIARLMKMQEQRMFHLQRIVQRARDDAHDAQAVSQRLAALEERLSEPAPSDAETSRVAAQVRHGLQTQLDAITRAIRRYEKRSAAQTMQLEARFHQVDARLQDALSLAAAAARTGQRPGLVAGVVGWAVELAGSAVQTACGVALYPLRTALAAAARVKSYFVADETPPRRGRSQGVSNGHLSRMQSKSMRDL